jgi:uncharacterized protein YggE
LRLAVVALAGLALAAIGRPADAQIFMGGGGGTENIEGLTVVGKGVVAAKPNRFEIELDVSAASELTADAIVKYRDAKKRITDAFAALKLGNVAVEERGLLVDQKGMMNPYYFNGLPQNSRNKTEVQLSRKLIVKGTDIRKLDEEAILQLVAKLLDVAQDAGAHVGQQNEYNPYYYNPYQRFNQGLVKFVVDDIDKVQEAAYEKAVADARARAERLARLSGVTLGPVVAIREVVVPGDHGPSNPYMDANSNLEEEAAAHKRIDSTKYQEVPVRVELLVRFELRPKGKDAAK